MTATSEALLCDDDKLPEGWERCLKRIYDEHGEVRYVPSRPIHFVMLALCFINTFAGTFLVPHCKNLSRFFGLGDTFAALIVCSPYLTNIAAVYLGKWMIPNMGWLVATLTNCYFMMAGNALCFVSLVIPVMRNPYMLLVGGLVTGMGMGQQFLGRQLGVETSSTTARNAIFAQQTIATSLGILVGTSTSGSTSLLGSAENISPVTLALPFAVLFAISASLAAFLFFFLPNRVIKVPAGETQSPVATTLKTPSVVMPAAERKLRIWSTVLVGFNRVVVRSMVENETTAFFQGLYNFPEAASSSSLALAYFVGIIALYWFGFVHDRLTDRTWIYITLALIGFGTVLQCPLIPEARTFEITKFTLGCCFVLPGLALNTAVGNSTATKYCIEDHWLYKQDMISLIQIVTQTSLARLIGPFLGYVLAMSSMRTTIAFQAVTTAISFFMVTFGVSSNAAETAKGRAALREPSTK